MHPLGLAAGAASAGLALNGLARLAFNLATLRLWSPTIAGEVAEIVAIGSLVSFVYAPVFAAYLGRYPAQAADGLEGAVARQIVVWCLGASAISSLIAAVWLATTGMPPEAWVAASLYGAALGLSTAFRSLYFWSHRLRRYVRTEALSWSVFGLCAAVALFYRVEALLYASWVVQGLTFAAVALADHADVAADAPRLTSWVSFRERAEFGILNLIGSFPSMATPQLALVVVGALGTKADVGYYAALVSLMTPMQLLPRSLSISFFPRISRERIHDPEGGRRLVVELTLVLIPSTLFVAIAALATSQIWMPLLIGSTRSDLLVVFGLLLIAQVVNIIGVPVIASQSAGGMREVSIPVVWSGIGLAMTLAVWGIVGGMSGPVVVALGVSVGMAARNVPPMIQFGHGSIRRWLPAIALWAPLTLLTLLLEIRGWAAGLFALPIALGILWTDLARFRRRRRDGAAT